MARENCTCPVELLGHHQASQLVSQRHRPQREKPPRRLPSARASSDHPSAGPTAKTMCCAPSSRRFPSHAAKASEVICRPRASSIMTTVCVRPLCRPSQSSSAFSFRNASATHGVSPAAAFEIATNQAVICVLRSRSGADMGERDLHKEENTAKIPGLSTCTGTVKSSKI